MTNHVSFWDRRRAAVRAEEQTEARRTAQVETARAEAALEGETDATLLARFGLPDPATLNMGDDFTAFMAKEVPARLRTLALRRLWRSNPVLACVDGLNDYDDDYLTGSTGNGAIATTYRVGKGLLAHIDDVARKAEAAAASLPEPELHMEPAEPEIALATPADTPAVEDAAPEDNQADDETPRDQAPRRMRFRFADGGQA